MRISKASTDPRIFDRSPIMQTSGDVLDWNMDLLTRMQTSLWQSLAHSCFGLTMIPYVHQARIIPLHDLESLLEDPYFRSRLSGCVFRLKTV